MSLPVAKRVKVSSSSDKEVKTIEASLDRLSKPRRKRTSTNTSHLTTPIKKHASDLTSSHKALVTTGRSQPCVCGCGIDCRDNYIKPFGADTQGRVRLLKMFSLHTKLSKESYWKIVGTKDYIVKS